MDIALIVLAIVGVIAVLNASCRQTHKAADGVRRVAYAGGAVFRAVFASAVIVGIQWATVSNAADNLTVLLPVLAIPALFAGTAIVRLLTDTHGTHVRGGGHQ